MCINGKCVYEHENAVDYEGRGNFLRKSGDFDEHENNIIDTPAPAQPTNERYSSKMFAIGTQNILDFHSLI